MPGERASSIARAPRSGRPRVWYRRCLPTAVTRLPTHPVDVARWPRVQRDSTGNADAVGLSGSSQFWRAYPILEGRASRSPPNREFRPQDFRPFIPLRTGRLTRPQVAPKPRRRPPASLCRSGPVPRHILVAMTEIPPAEADRRPTTQAIGIRPDLLVLRAMRRAQEALDALA